MSKSKMSRGKQQRSKRTIESKAKKPNKRKKRPYVLESDSDDSDESNHSLPRKQRPNVHESDSDDSDDSNHSGYSSSSVTSPRQVVQYVRQQENKADRIATFWSTVNVDNLMSKVHPKLKHTVPALRKGLFMRVDMLNFDDKIEKPDFKDKCNRFIRSALKEVTNDNDKRGLMEAFKMIKKEKNYFIDQVVFLGDGGYVIVHWKDHQGDREEYGFIRHRDLRFTGRSYARLLVIDLHEFEAWRPKTWDEFRVQHDTIMRVYKCLKERHRDKKIERFGDVTNFVDYLRAHVSYYRDRVLYICVIDFDWFMYFVFCLRRFLSYVYNGDTRIRAARDRDFDNEKDYFDLLITLDASLFHEELMINCHSK